MGIAIRTCHALQNATPAKGLGSVLHAIHAGLRYTETPSRMAGSAASDARKREPRRRPIFLQRTS